MRYLITGGCGFVGANLAKAVLEKKESLTIADNLSRHGSTSNLEWLKLQGNFDFSPIDIRDQQAVEQLIQSCCPDVIFHLAGQVAMTTSICHPLLDFETNALGSMHVLEAVRKYCKETIIIYSSTNKVYGDLENIHYQETAVRYEAVDFPNGFPETLPLNFQSPYGCSKGSADQYMLDYARMFGLKTIVFRHSSMYGGRQHSTFDQGWVGWFIQQALKTVQNNAHTFTIAGNGKQVRDLLYASDLTACYFAAVKNIDAAQGQVFNIGGGPQNSLSLLELLEILQKKLNTVFIIEKLPARQSDQKVFIADIQKAKTIFNWMPNIDCYQGIDKTIEWIRQHVS